MTPSDRWHMLAVAAWVGVVCVPDKGWVLFLVFVVCATLSLYLDRGDSS